MADSEQLVVPLVAKVDDFERNFKRAGRTAVREFSAIEDRSKQAAQRLEANMTKAAQNVRLSLGTIATAFGAGALLGGLTQLPDAMRDVVKGVADIGREAERVGVLTDELQGLQYGFERVGIDAGASYDAIQEFGKRVAEAATGSGELKDILAANGVALRNSDGSMRSTMALLRDYAGLIGNATSEADRLLLADKGFSNMQMASALRGGASAIDAMIFAAKDAGAVIDAELVAKAQDVDIEFANLSRSLETFAKEKSIEFMSALADMGGALADFAAQIGVAWTKLDDFWNDVTGRDMEAVAMQSLRGKLAFKKFDKPEDFPFYQFQPTPAAKPTVTTPTVTTPIEATVHGGNRPTRPSGGVSSGGGGGGASGPTGYEKILEHVREFIAQQGVEQSAIGKTAQEAAKLRYEQDLLNQATRAGITLTPQQRNELGSLAATMAQAEQATRSLTETQQAGQEAGKFFGQGIADAFTGVITGAMTAQEAIKGLIDSLIQAVIQAALLGDGPLGGLFGGGGGLLGGLFGFKDGGEVKGYARGGLINGPGTGTSDSVPILSSNGEFVVNAAATKRNLAMLHAINDGKVAAFASGGIVGDSPSVRAANANIGHANDNTAPVFQISAPITINGSSGTPDQNSDLAKKMAKQMEGTMRGVVADELRRAQRPGNIANTRAR